VNGDIRVNIIKDGSGKWILVGHVFQVKILNQESAISGLVFSNKKLLGVGSLLVTLLEKQLLRELNLHYRKTSLNLWKKMLNYCLGF
jgi:hypothetical protein